MTRLSQIVVAGLLLLPIGAGTALAKRINTGGGTGAYHSSFCPVLAERLKKEQFNYECATSNGTADNMARVAEKPSELGYGQLDVMAMKADSFGGPSAFTRIRVDDVRECLFAVARNKELSNFGEVAVRADKLRFILPPENSGSAGTFEYLKKIDPYGLGRAGTIIHASTTDEAIRTALAADDTVSLFVQFPDPDNARFKIVQDLGGHIVPVIDRNILDQKLEGRQIYFAQETQVANARWLKSGTKVVTACTPLVLFTGASKKIPDQAARIQHQGLIYTLQNLSADALAPKQSLFARVLKRTRELSAVSAAKFIDLSEKARERAKPLLDKAREATEKALEAAKPAADAAREGAGQILEPSESDAK